MSMELLAELPVHQEQDWLVLKGKYYLKTFGCQMNEHDAEKMQSILEHLGLERTQTPEDADIFIINTCSIREKAGQKVFSLLGKLKFMKQKRPHSVLVVCGCLAQQEGTTIFRRAPYVDIVFGPRNIPELPNLIQRILRGEHHILSLSRPRQTPSFQTEATHRFSKVKAYITIMEGCDKFCTFCIVPFTRGREIYRSPDSILAEARRLAEQGYKEIILLGQTVNSWKSEKMRFSDLLVKIAEIDGIERIRFTSPHPSDVTDDLIEVYRTCEKVCKHIHLPLQSGSNRILKAMRRTYTRETYLEVVEKLRESIPHIALTTDVIVGFPGESERDFKETMDMIEYVRFDSMFSFKYSPRPFTKAWKFGDPVPDQVKRERLITLQKRQNEIQYEKNKQFIGTIQRVLFEGPSRKDPNAVEGRMDDNRIVNIQIEPEKVLGTFGFVRILDAGPNALIGDFIRHEVAEGLENH